MDGLDTGIAHFNYLVRCAGGLQEQFDKFDPRTPAERVELVRICEEWDRANAAVIDFVMLHGAELLKEIDQA